MERVETYDGTMASRRDCRFIKGAYYIKHKQCFWIVDRWYRINSDYVAYDHESKTWILKSTKGLIRGIVKILDNNIPEFGYFMENRDKNVFLLYNGLLEPVYNLSVFKHSFSIREGMNGHYYFSDDKRIPKEFTNKIKPRKDGFYSFPFNYGSEPLIPEFVAVFINEFKGEDLLSDAYKYLNGYMYGVEFETERGAIPERYLRNHGLIACRDGSISGFEYATVPLYGVRGLQAIKANCELLKRFCSCSPNESLHIHISGYPRTIKAIAALFRLGLLLEKEVYKMFPYYYADTSKFKKKSYCGPLPLVGLKKNTPHGIFSELFSWLSNGQVFGRSLPSGPHPMDRSGQHKWEISPRYVWLNMIPLIWGGRGTVEFRCHTPTVNSQKVINWLYITVAILKYAKKHATELTSGEYLDTDKLTLDKILDEIYPKKISRILTKYIEDRIAYYAHKNDSTGELEIFSEERNTEVCNLIQFV